MRETLENIVNQLCNNLNTNYFTTISKLPFPHTNSLQTNTNNTTIRSRACLKADTGASGTFIKSDHRHYLQNLSPLQHGPVVHLPNNHTLKTTHQGILQLNDSPHIQTYVLPGMKNESLLSIGQLCDKGCNAVFSKDKLNVYLNNKIILQRTRNTKDGLWDVPFDQQEIRLNYIVKKNQPKYKLVQYLHACVFSPALDAFTKAIKNGNFISWPGMNEIDFKKTYQTSDLLY